MPDQNDPKAPGWGQRRRLEFIDFRLQWDGTLNRADLREAFSISTPQASLDIGQYAEEHPSNLIYDRSTRTYVAPPGFKAAFGSSGPRHYLTQLFAWAAGIIPEKESILGYKPPVAMVTLPTRTTDAKVLRRLIHAIKNRETLEVDYQSIAREEPLRRFITPHAFGQDGVRWHVRAYCSLRKGFRDFVLGRILAVHGSAAAKIEATADEQWNRILTLTLVPHPELSPALRKGIEIDYGMVDGRTRLQVRQAMLFYEMRSLGLRENGEPMPGVRQVLIENLDDLGELPVLGQP